MLIHTEILQPFPIPCISIGLADDVAAATTPETAEPVDMTIAVADGMSMA